MYPRWAIACGIGRPLGRFLANVQDAKRRQLAIEVKDEAHTYAKAERHSCLMEEILREHRRSFHRVRMAVLEEVQSSVLWVLLPPLLFSCKEEDED